MSRRTERVGHLIRAIVAEAIQSRLSDPRIPPITSVTRVEVSEDFALATVYVSVLAEEPRRRLCLTGLRSAAGLLRRILAPQLRLRKLPALTFRLDDSLRQQAATLAVIDAAMRDLGEVPDWEREDAEADEVGEEASDSPADPPAGEWHASQTGDSRAGGDGSCPSPRSQEGT